MFLEIELPFFFSFTFDFRVGGDWVGCLSLEMKVQNVC